MNIPFLRPHFFTDARVMKVKWPVVLYRAETTKRLGFLVVLGKSPAGLRQDLSAKNARFCFSGARKGLRLSFTVSSAAHKHTFWV